MKIELSKTDKIISLVKNAESKIYIIAGNLCSDLANNSEYIYELSNFIEREGSLLKILLMNFNKESAILNSKLLKRLAYYSNSEYGDSIEVRILKENVIKNDAPKLFFTLNDRGGYSIETDNDISSQISFVDKNGVLSENLLNYVEIAFLNENSKELDFGTLFK